MRCAMGRQPESKAQDILNQIEDVILNHYEDDHKYTARELRQILDSIVAILDTYKALDASVVPAASAIALQSQPDPHSEPRVPAVVYSDDHAKRATFPANRWFAVASDEEIRDLARIGWGYDLEADRIAYFLRDLYSQIEQVLEYCRQSKWASTEPVGFEVSVNKAQAMAWLATHRSDLWQELEDLHP